MAGVLPTPGATADLTVTFTVTGTVSGCFTMPGGGDLVQINCGISRFCNAWTRYAKRSIRMKCRARYGAAKLNVPLFDGFDHGRAAQTSFDELDFRSGSQDMFERGFYLAGRFVEDSLLDMGSLNPHGRFVHQFINGAY